jgi:hypothetical protein
MVRTRFRRTRRSRTSSVAISRHFSSVNVTFDLVHTANQLVNWALVLPATNVAGRRVARGFKITISSWGTPQPVYYALVYMPEGAQPSNFVLNLNTAWAATTVTETFGANQWVISTGAVPLNDTLRAYSGQSRSLNNGDTIVLILKRVHATSASEPIVSDTAFSVNIAFQVAY